MLMRLLFALGFAWSITTPAHAAATYDELCPLYVESCAATMVTHTNHDRGNPFGHALVYVKGLCPVRGAPFPQVRPCAPGETDLRDPEAIRELRRLRSLPSARRAEEHQTHGYFRKPS